MNRPASRRTKIGLGFLAFFLVLFSVGKFTNLAQPLLCHFQLQAPQNQLIEGQFEVGTDWTEIQLNQPLLPAANVQELVLMVRPGRGRVSFSEDVGAQAYGVASGRLQILNNQQDVWLDVRLVDQQDRMITLYPSGDDYVHEGWVLPFNSQMRYNGIAYALNSRSWAKVYFPESMYFPRIQLRASQPVVLDAIRWIAGNHYFSPCKAYSAIPTEKIFNFDVPQPPLTRPDVPGWPSSEPK